MAIEKKANEFEKNERNCIDALNSMGYCIKFRTSLQDMLQDKEIEDGNTQPTQIQIGANQNKGIGVFSQLVKIYTQALTYDQDDVEANFNLAGLYLQRNELDQALKFFKNCIRKDELEGYPEIKTLFAQQFAKAYFNIGIIYDHK